MILSCFSSSLLMLLLLLFSSVGRCTSPAVLNAHGGEELSVYVRGRMMVRPPTRVAVYVVCVVTLWCRRPLWLWCRGLGGAAPPAPLPRPRLFFLFPPDSFTLLSRLPLPRRLLHRLLTSPQPHTTAPSWSPNTFTSRICIVASP